MKLYEITVQLLSGLCTPLKGDTLFGQFCWEIFQSPELINGNIEEYLSIYDQKPFLIFSSAHPKLIIKDSTLYVLKRPSLPSYFMFEPKETNLKERMYQLKIHKKKKWFLFNPKDGVINTKKIDLLDDEELLTRMYQVLTPEIKNSLKRISLEALVIRYHLPHNTINRLTNTTGAPPFSPYAVEGIYYIPETELVIFALIDEEMINIEQVLQGLENIGSFGFGRDASTGMGRFKLAECDEISFFDSKYANSCYLLSPCVPEEGSFMNVYFTPFIRFGRHGNYLANSRNPFKNPVVMMDEGSVFIPKNRNIFDRLYVGSAVKGISKVCENTVLQGYSIFIPMKLEIKDDDL